MGRWIISCKQHSELASACLDRPLSLWERLSARIHQILCPPCGQVGSQFDAIREACRQKEPEGTVPEDPGCEGSDCVLPEEVRKRMKADLQKLRP